MPRNPFLPSTFNPNAVAPSDFIPGSEVQETTAIRQGTIPTVEEEELAGVAPLRPTQPAAKPLPTPPAPITMQDRFLRGLLTFGVGLGELGTAPQYRRGETDAFIKTTRDREELVRSNQQLAYVLQLRAHGTPQALQTLTAYAPEIKDAKVLAVVDQVVTQLTQKAEMATALRQTMGTKGEDMAKLLEAGIPPQLVPAYVGALAKSEDPLNQVKFFPELGGYYLWNKKTQKPEFVSDPRLLDAVKLSREPAAVQLQNAIAVDQAGLPLDALIKKAQEGDAEARLHLREVVGKLSDKNLTNDLDRFAYNEAKLKKIPNIANWKDLSNYDPKLADEVYRKYQKYQLEQREAISGATGLAAAMARLKAEETENPLMKAAEGRFIRRESLAPGRVSTMVTDMNNKELRAAMEKGTILPIVDRDQLKQIKGMEVIEQQMIPEVERVMKQLPKDAGWATLYRRLANPWKRYLGVADEPVQVQGASEAFALQLAKIFQGGAAALSDADRRAAALLTMHDGDTTGSVLIKVGIMRRMAGNVKAVAAGVDPRTLKATYTDAEVTGLETQLQKSAGQAPFGPGIRLKRAE